jgi:hypothetical protein
MWPMLIWHMTGTRSGRCRAMAARILSLGVIAGIVPPRPVHRQCRDFHSCLPLLRKEDETGGMVEQTFEGLAVLSRF